MKSNWFSVAGFVFTAVLVAGSARSGTQALPEAARPILIVSVGPSSPAVMKRIQGHLAAQFDCPVRIAPDQMILRDTPEGQADALARLLKEGDAFLIALMNVPQNTRFVQAVLASRRTALLNVRYPDEPLASDAASVEKVLRRVEEDASRLVANLAGLSSCPIKLCALHFEQSTAKPEPVHSRSLCPPCQGRVHDALVSGKVAVPEK